MTKFKTCDGCHNEFPVTMLRYHKCADGEWRYLCRPCRDAVKANEAAARVQ